VTSSLINNSTTLVCEWFARAKCGGDNGLAKGFCDVPIYYYHGKIG